MSAGYSGTPLPKKLGIKPGHRVMLLNAPAGFSLPDVPVVTRASGMADVILSFHTQRSDLAKRIPVLRERMEQAAGLWIAWPKKAAKLDTDIDENVVRELGLREPARGQQSGGDRRDLVRPTVRNPPQRPATLTI